MKEKNGVKDMEMLYHTTYESSIGIIHILTSEKYVEKIILFEEEWAAYPQETLQQEKNRLGEEVKKQLDEYFSNQREVFLLPYRLKGTPFQIKVWEALQQIPYGEIRSYKDIAIAIEKEAAVRAIGQANKKNRLPILIPCHRVIGKSGKMIGYGGAHTDIKEKLLALEKIKK